MYHIGIKKPLLLLASILVLVGCGGGGSGSTASETDDLTIDLKPIVHIGGNAIRQSPTYMELSLKNKWKDVYANITGSNAIKHGLTYRWFLEKKPEESQAFIQDTHKQRTKLYLDKAGKYILKLETSDGDIALEPSFMTFYVGREKLTKREYYYDNNTTAKKTEFYSYDDKWRMTEKWVKNAESEKYRAVTCHYEQKDEGVECKQCNTYNEGSDEIIVTTSSCYSALDQLLETNASGSATMRRYSYDSKGRETSYEEISKQDGSLSQFRYTKYNGQGELIEQKQNIRNNSLKEQYHEFNNKGHLIKKTKVYATTNPHKYVTVYQYNTSDILVFSNTKQYKLEDGALVKESNVTYFENGREKEHITEEYDWETHEMVRKDIYKYTTTSVTQEIHDIKNNRHTRTEYIRDEKQRPLEYIYYPDLDHNKSLKYIKKRYVYQGDDYNLTDYANNGDILSHKIAKVTYKEDGTKHETYEEQHYYSENVKFAKSMGKETQAIETGDKTYKLVGTRDDHPLYGELYTQSTTYRDGSITQTYEKRRRYIESRHQTVTLSLESTYEGEYNKYSHATYNEKGQIQKNEYRDFKKIDGVYTYTGEHVTTYTYYENSPTLKESSSISKDENGTINRCSEYRYNILENMTESITYKNDCSTEDRKTVYSREIDTPWE